MEKGDVKLFSNIFQVFLIIQIFIKYNINSRYSLDSYFWNYLSGIILIVIARSTNDGFFSDVFHYKFPL